MAIYLTHNYGTRFYGPEPDLPNFNPASFKAFSLNYKTVRVSWDDPTGEYDRFRLVKGRWGYPVSEIDGEVLIDSDTPTTNYNDTGVRPGEFVYYSAFLKVGGTWMWAAVASCLHIRDWRSAEWLWERLPIHYRILRGNRLDLEADENDTLARYMAIIGWGLDRVRTSLNAAWHSQDPTFAHIDIIDILIQQYGLPAYPGLSGARKRSFVRDGAALLSRRGTLDEMIAEARAASGWDVVLRPSPNLMLTDDSSRMLNPIPDDWDPMRIYTTGDRVRLEGADYVCKVASASGYDQQPSGDRTSNTWWDPLLVVEPNGVAYDPASRSQHGWAPQSFSGNINVSQVVTELVRGAPRPLDPTFSVNAVTVKNTTANQTGDIGARCLPEPSAQVQPLTATTYGIPLPRPSVWRPDVAYAVGSLVLYQGRLYRAIRPGRIGSPPKTSPRWQVVGTDSRIRLTLSAYTHQPHTAPTRPVDPALVYAEFYDSRGQFLCREFCTNTESRVLDTFSTYHVGTSVFVTGPEFAVNGSTSYTASGWFYQPTSDNQVRLTIQWFNGSGSLISESSQTVNMSPAAWAQVSFAANSPASAATARFAITYLGSPVSTQPLIADEIMLAETGNPGVAVNPNYDFSEGVSEWSGQYCGRVEESDTGHNNAPALRIQPDGVSAIARLDGRTTEYGNKPWTGEDGKHGFRRDSYTSADQDYGVIRPAVEGERAIALIDYGTANAAVAATLTTDAPEGQVQAIVVRAASTTSYIRATRQKLQTVNGGTVTDLVTYGTPISDGDRMTVRTNGTNISVFRNGVQVATATSSFNQSATRFGLVVE